MEARELANAICNRLQQHGYQAYLVGGCVRDLLMGRSPVDFDVATDASPQRVVQLFPEAIAVGAQFGVVLVPGSGFKVEVATFRSDVGYTDGRHPDHVEYANTPQEDVKRRDFTINGLLMRHDTGEVLDFVGGQEDLCEGVIRAIGEADRRFTEDKLRMLRAARFAARFGFAIEPSTFRAIRRHAREIHRVSAERIRDELTKLLTEGAARTGFELLEKTWLLPIVLPEVAAMKGVQQPPQYHPEGDVWVHTLMMIGGLPAGCSATLAWGTLLHDVGKPPTFRSERETGDRIRFDGHVNVGSVMARAICRRLRFSTDDTDQIVALVANHMKFKDVRDMRPSTLKRFVRMPKFEEHLALHRLDCLGSHRNLGHYEFVQNFLRDTPREQVHPDRFLTGDDLIGLGYRPGPTFSEMMRELEDAQLEGHIRNREEAVEFLKSRYPLEHLMEEQGDAQRL